MCKIVQEPHKALRTTASEIPVADITSETTKKIIHDLKVAMHREPDGVAIAAPQIGVSLRIFVVSGRIFDEDFIRGKGSTEGNLYVKARQPDLVFINPILKKMSSDKKLLSEGCLSVRPIYGKVRRATRATVEAYNEKGEKVVKSGSGLLAHIFQHETDHLDGILFIDKAKDMHESLIDEDYDELNTK